MAYRNKYYVAFYYDDDKNYYHTLEMWQARRDINFDFYNAHDINNIKKTSNEDTIKRNLRERLDNTKLMILLIGNNTKYRDWVKWEVEQAITRNIPILVVSLNKDINPDFNLLPSELFKYKIGYSIFELESMRNGINNYPDFYSSQQLGYYQRY